jgi:2-oxoglutarate ferredoxin oxidoreductase subunit alpha
MASGDIKECFYDAASAFNYAEKYQLPVIHLIDKALANSSQTYDIFQTSQFKIDRGTAPKENSLNEDYKRFQFTDTGVSPRHPLGTKDRIYWLTGDEHNEIGHISEEPVNRTAMVEKRMKKLETADREIPDRERINFFGERSAENVVISWGSPKGAILEAMSRLDREHFSLRFIQFRMIHPFPTRFVVQALAEAKNLIAVENNYSGQLAEIVRENTGIQAGFRVLKYNGRPMSTTEVYDALRRIITHQATERQVLSYGS